jgi:hypothetical protein
MKAPHKNAPEHIMSVHGPYQGNKSERGNVLFIIFLAIVLLGALTAAIQFNSRPEGATIDKEKLIFRVTEVQRYASELERAVLFIMEQGKSESDIRFAHPDAPAEYGDLHTDTDPSRQVFHPQGGGALYRAAPEGINDGSPWEFYGGTHLPGVGSDRAELIAVLPNVTAQFCQRINEVNGQTGTPADTGTNAANSSTPSDCLNLGAGGRISDTRQFYETANTVDESSFAQDPATGRVRTALQACVVCSVGPANHFYHVLLAR